MWIRFIGQRINWKEALDTFEYDKNYKGFSRSFTSLIAFKTVKWALNWSYSGLSIQMGSYASITYSSRIL